MSFLDFKTKNLPADLVSGATRAETAGVDTTAGKENHNQPGNNVKEA